MIKLVILLFLSLFSIELYAQKANLTSAAMNSCSGAINIFEDGDFQLQFTGESSESDIEKYSSLSSIDSENLLWCSFIAPFTGELTFNASVKSGYLQMVIFEEEGNAICEDIHAGSSEIKRLHTGKEANAVGLDYKVSDGILYALRIKEGKKIQLLFATNSETKEKMLLQWKFNPLQQQVSESKIVDKRFDDFAPVLSISVRDKVTNKALVANLSIEGSKDLDALYNGSDFLFNVDRNCKITIKCDVEGYFFDDRIETVSAFEDQEIMIYLEQIASGKSIKIEEIEFVPGTSDITVGSEPKLRRLKDFLALNSEMNIEIQGHVFALGDNSFAGQKISEARAKRVMKYLIDNGIDKSRLSAVGFGNTRPIYPEPRFLYEEQANRRVEIVVK